jgi:hypothetical protein
MKKILVILLLLVALPLLALGRFNRNGAFVTDTITGLTWTRCPMSDINTLDTTDQCTSVRSSFTWNDAITACNNLDYDGQNNWRLPNIRELFTLIFHRGYFDQQTMDKDAFPNYQSGVLINHFWSSTVYNNLPMADGDLNDIAFYVDFLAGNIGPSPITDNTKYVRCVSGP